MSKSFIENYSFEERFEVSKKLTKEYPDRLPIICEPFDKNVVVNNYKYLVPKTTISTLPPEPGETTVNTPLIT